jgi:hypothetical protein
MEVDIGNGVGLQSILLEDSSRIFDLLACNPWGPCQFRLQAKEGSIVKIYDSEIRPDSVYKSIILSEDSTVADTIGILQNCYHKESEVDFALYEFCKETLTSRLLEAEEKPLELMQRWGSASNKVFQLRQRPVERPPRACAVVEQLVRNSLLRQSMRRIRALGSVAARQEELDLSSEDSLSLSCLTLSQSSLGGDALDECCGNITSGMSSVSSEVLGSV